MIEHYERPANEAEVHVYEQGLQLLEERSRSTILGRIFAFLACILLVGALATGGLLLGRLLWNYLLPSWSIGFGLSGVAGALVGAVVAFRWERDDVRERARKLRFYRHEFDRVCVTGVVNVVAFDVESVYRVVQGEEAIWVFRQPDGAAFVVRSPLGAALESMLGRDAHERWPGERIHVRLPSPNETLPMGVYMLGQVFSEGERIEDVVDLAPRLFRPLAKLDGWDEHHLDWDALEDGELRVLPADLAAPIAASDPIGDGVSTRRREPTDWEFEELSRIAATGEHELPRFVDRGFLATFFSLLLGGYGAAIVTMLAGRDGTGEASSLPYCSTGLIAFPVAWWLARRIGDLRQRTFDREQREAIKARARECLETGEVEFVHFCPTSAYRVDVGAAFKTELWVLQGSGAHAVVVGGSPEHRKWPPSEVYIVSMPYRVVAFGARVSPGKKLPEKLDSLAKWEGTGWIEFDAEAARRDAARDAAR